MSINTTLNKFNPQPHHLIWIDLEMTGLNPEYHHILEISIAITDQQLNLIDNNFDLIIHQPDNHLRRMDAVVNNMHTNNGLIAASKESTTVVEVAEQLALQFVAKHVSPKISPMCGNSICLDRRFLCKYMPTLEAYFHYRNLDVSTIKNLSYYWYPELVKNFKKLDSSHRATTDILQSIEELKFYKQYLFK
jgi:oligoribonuclease